MVRIGLREIEREIDAEARERFPGGAVRQAVLLQYGDNPEIEAGNLWVRVLLDADGPDDYERAMQAFQHDHEAAMEEFAGHWPRHSARSGWSISPPRKPSTAKATAPGGTCRFRGKACRRAGMGTRGITRWTCTPAGPSGLETRRHADHGGHRGHPRGRDPLGPGPHPRAARIRTAP